MSAEQQETFMYDGTFRTLPSRSVAGKRFSTQPYQGKQAVLPSVLRSKTPGRQMPGRMTPGRMTRPVTRENRFPDDLVIVEQPLPQFHKKPVKPF